MGLQRVQTQLNNNLRSANNSSKGRHVIQGREGRTVKPQRTWDQSKTRASELLLSRWEGTGVLIQNLLTVTIECGSWRRQWQPTPVLLPGKSHGWRSLVGCSPWHRKEWDTTEWLHFHFLPSRIGEGNGNPPQCSCLENPRDGGAWWAAIYGAAQSRTRLKRLSSWWLVWYANFFSHRSAACWAVLLPRSLRKRASGTEMQIRL